MSTAAIPRRPDRSVQQKRGAKNADNNNNNNTNNSNDGNAKMSVKTFEPARKKLTSVESQRIVNSLDECVEKLEIATLVPEVVLKDMDRFQTMLGQLTTTIGRKDTI